MLIIFGIVFLTAFVACQQENCQKVLVPAYFYPSWWSSVNEWNRTDLPRDGIFIMNPGNGPTATVNYDYVAAIDIAKAAGNKIVGYVYTQWGSRNDSIVKADMDLYMSQYNVDGFFFDEAATGIADLPYYQDLADYVKAIDVGKIVITNPGVPPVQEYIDVADITVVFEHNFIHYRDHWVGPSYLNDYPPSKFAHLVYNMSGNDLELASKLSFERNAGFVYLTDDDLPNPWDTLPAYVAQEDHYLHTQCGNCNTETVANALGWLKSMISDTGFIQSFLADPEEAWAEDTAYAYDQAVAAIAFLLNADHEFSDEVVQAELILNAVQANLVAGVSNHGEVTYTAPFSWKTTIPHSPLNLYRSGAVGWVAEAFALHWLLTGRDNYKDAAMGIGRWLVDRYEASGSNKCVTGGPDVTWCSTEHNIDSFFALHMISHLAGGVSLFDDVTGDIADVLNGPNVWHSSQDRFRQGLYDDYRALDCQSWGSIFLTSNGRTETDFVPASRAAASMSFAEDFFRNQQRSVLPEHMGMNMADGYGPYADSSNDYHANVVWSEGSLGVALAYLRMNRRLDMITTMHGLDPLVGTDGSVLYAANTTTVDVSGSQFYSFPSVAGSGWWALTCSPRQSIFWNAKEEDYAVNHGVLGNTNSVSPTSALTMAPTVIRPCTYGKLTSDGKDIKQPYSNKKPHKYDTCPTAVMSYDLSCLPITHDSFSISAKKHKLTISASGGGKFKLPHKKVATFNKEKRFGEFMMDACKTQEEQLLDIFVFSETDGLHVLVTVRDSKGKVMGSKSKTVVKNAAVSVCGGQSFGQTASFTCVTEISDK